MNVGLQSSNRRVSSFEIKLDIKRLDGYTNTSANTLRQLDAVLLLFYLAIVFYMW